MARQGRNEMTETIGMNREKEQAMTANTNTDMAESLDGERGKVLRRRGLLAGAAAVAAGMMAAKSADAVKANGEVITVGSQITGITVETHLTGSTGNVAIPIFHASQDGTGSAIHAISTSPSGGSGLYALSYGSDGVYGTTSVGGGSIAAIHGSSTNTSGNGVVGECTGGTTAYGVWGKTDEGRAVIGTASGGGTGVFGQGGKYGVIGQISSVPNTIAVLGSNTSAAAGGIGVQGIVNSATATGTIGVYGANLCSAPNSHGIVGLSNHGHGLVGTCNAHPAAGNTYAGLVGFAGVPDANAGNFYGNVAVGGNLLVTGSQTALGAKSAALAHPDGSHRLVYCVEAPESILEDFGKATLSGGRADVKLDADFTAVADMNDYHVFLTAYGSTQGFDVASQSPTGFTVVERNKGASGGKFSYRVVAKRKDIKAGRLAKFAVPTMQPPTFDAPTAPALDPVKH
jgi:hypothetical protein